MTIRTWFQFATLAEKMTASLGQMDDVRARLTGAGIEIQGGTPEHFGNVFKNEVDKWGRIVKEAGIQPE